MSDEIRFEVRPLRRYDGAQYPSAWRTAATPGTPAQVGPPAERASPRLPTLLLLGLLMLGLALGAVGCFADYRTQPCPGDLPRDDSGNCPPGPDPDCDPGALACEDMVLLVCDADGQGWSGQDCDAYCREMYGPDAWATGCDAAAEDPCGCEYDIIDGDVARCTPGEFDCLDAERVNLCGEDYSWQQRDCDAYCRETHGEGYVSYGCDDDAEQPCRCDYDQLDGAWAGCQPGDIYCQDDETLMVCAEDGTSYDEIDCTEHCEQEYGLGYFSGGCDAEEAESTANPCRCVREGEPVEP